MASDSPTGRAIRLVAICAHLAAVFLFAEWLMQRGTNREGAITFLATSALLVLIGGALWTVAHALVTPPESHNQPPTGLPSNKRLEPTRRMIKE